MKIKRKRRNTNWRRAIIFSGIIDKMFDLIKNSIFLSIKTRFSSQLSEQSLQIPA